MQQILADEHYDILVMRGHGCKQQQHSRPWQMGSKEYAERGVVAKKNNNKGTASFA